MSLNQKSTYYYILCYFPIQFCVSLCIGCTGKRSGISAKGFRNFCQVKDFVAYVNNALNYLSTAIFRSTVAIIFSVSKYHFSMMLKGLF